MSDQPAAASAASIKLNEAARNGDLAGIQAALAAGADPQSKHGADGSTPLMGAAIQGSIPCVMALMKVSDIEARDNDGETALMYAARYSGATVEALLTSADPLARDRMGRTAFMQAARKGNPSIIKSFFGVPGFLAIDNYGQTAIEQASDILKGSRFAVVREIKTHVPDEQEVARAAAERAVHDAAKAASPTPAPARARRGL